MIGIDLKARSPRISMEVDGKIVTPKPARTIPTALAAWVTSLTGIASAPRFPKAASIVLRTLLSLP